MTTQTVYGFLVNIKDLCSKELEDLEGDELNDAIYESVHDIIGTSFNETLEGPVPDDSEVPNDSEVPDDTKVDSKILFFKITHDVLDRMKIKDGSFVIVGISIYDTDSIPFASEKRLTKRKKKFIDCMPTILKFLKLEKPFHLGLYNSQDNCVCCS